MKRLIKIGWFQLIFAWYDLWVGFYYDVGHRTLYFIPIPCIVFRFQLSTKKDETKHRLDRANAKKTINQCKY